jgi:hypothetical protein
MQIEVAFVNRPNKNPKFGSIKGTDGIYYSVGADVLDRYRQGQTFDAPVSSREYQGKTYYSIPDSFDPNTVGAIIPQPNGHAPAPSRPASTPSNGNGSNQYRNPREMFLCEVVGRAMGSGKFSAQDIGELTAEADKAWGTYG